MPLFLARAEEEVTARDLVVEDPHRGVESVPALERGAAGQQLQLFEVHGVVQVDDQDLVPRGQPRREVGDEALHHHDVRVPDGGPQPRPGRVPAREVLGGDRAAGGGAERDVVTGAAEVGGDLVGANSRAGHLPAQHVDGDDGDPRHAGSG